MRHVVLRFSLVLFFLFGTAFSHAQRLPDFTQLVEDSYPAVVNISTTSHTPSGPQPGLELGPEFENSPFGELFRKFLDQNNQAIPPQEAQSLGSGFIISEDGYILTNNHVVEEADEVIVRLSDRRQLVAQVVGTDKRSDMAVLKVDARDLPVVRIGNVDALKVGEWVLAIGSPFGFDFSVTAGIVSAKGRALPSENYVPFIQTDVAINPGNSGGPLFNLKGEVIGINSQIYSRTGGFMGLSFAIPIDVAMDVATQIKQNGAVSRGWLGVIIQEVTRELAESFAMETAHGALISRIMPDSPAAASKLQVGDIIIAFNGKKVVKSSSLPPLVGQAVVGKASRVTVVRNGQEKEIDVVIGELPSQSAISNEVRGQKDKREPLEKQRLQMGVKPVTSQQREQLQITGGVSVDAVDPAGVAAQAGVRVGDVVTMIDNRKVTNLADYERVITSLKAGQVVPMLVQRGSGPLFLAIKVAQ